MREAMHVSVTFFTRLDIRTGVYAQRFYNLIGEYNGVFVPQEFDGGELTEHQWVPFDPTDPELPVRVWKQLGSVLMRRREPVECLITFTMHFQAGGRFNTGSISVAEQYFELPENPAAFLRLCLALYDLLHPAYGFSHQISDELEASTEMDPKYGRTVMPMNLSKGLPGVYWANFLGPEYVKMFGRRQLLSAPSHHVQELLDGGILILTSESPLNPASKDSRLAQWELRQFLGENVFYPSQATSRRTPEFRFGVPDSADTQNLLDDSLYRKKRIAQAQNLIANAEEFASLLTEELSGQGVELDQSPRSLRILEQHLLQKRETGKMLDDFSAKMFAAYAGEVARQALNGEWIVDDLTGEAAVDIKGARIFPLARILKFLESDEGDVFTTILGILAAEAEP